MSGLNTGIMRMVRGRLPIVVTALAAFAVGYLVSWSVSGPAPDRAPLPLERPGAQAVRWTCSMHPQIDEDGPGKCPICFMDLIPVTSDTSAEAVSPRQFTTSAAAKALMDIQTSPVEKRFVAAAIRMVGKVTYDETRLAYITAWAPGRADRLYVDYTGVTVRKGDHMVYLYSPEILTAQEELRRAARAVEGLKSDSPAVVRRSAEATLDAARRKLRLWGLTDAQIERAEQSGAVSDHITVYAPMGGTVVHKNAQQGMYLETGTRIYTIADLSRVWVKLDAYESDVPWLRYGQKVAFTTEAYPGETFHGWIAFIDPVVDERTRTVKVRVNVPNPEGKLKPEMFVRGVVRAQVATGGRVMAPDLAGKWVSPMHPEIVKDEPGTCDVCGMPLVRAESLGYLPITADEAAMPLVIPATAPLITGARAIVYVEVPGTERPTFEGREVALGPRAGDYYLVRGGLQEGERVVTNGNFKIDSALQILARPSMMTATAAEGVEGGAGKPVPMVDVPAAFRAQLDKVVRAYLALQSALAADATRDAASQKVAALEGALGRVDMETLGDGAHMVWMGILERIEPPVEEMTKAKDIEGLRSGFSVLSPVLAEAIEKFGLETAEGVYRVRCPMAFEWRGATWLQEGEAIRNPYFGSAMLECGTVLGRLGGGLEGAPPSGRGNSVGHSAGSHAKGDD